MKVIGFLCGLDRMDNTEVLHRSFVLHRVKPLYDYLIQYDVKLFMYNPVFIEPDTLVVPGYFFDGHGYYPAIQKAPKVNANYLLHSKRWLNQGMGYKSYQEWSAGQGIRAFPSWKVIDAFVDKQKTFEILNAFKKNLHPYTDIYSGSVVQMKNFINKSARVFIKNRYGVRGQKMFALNYINDEYILYYHTKRKVDCYAFKMLDKVLNKINSLVSDDSYIIQEGVIMDKLDGSVFNIHMLMYHDGEKWAFVEKSLISDPGCYVTLAEFGAKYYYTKELLKNIYGETKYMDIYNKVADKCLELTRYLDRVFSGQIMEVAYDCLIKNSEIVYLIEVNMRPGMRQVEPIKDIFNMSKHDMQIYDTYVKPHMSGVGEFLRKQLLQLSTNS